jgi:nicotinamide-nucleotide amidase
MQNLQIHELETQTFELAARLGRRSAELGWMLVTAESCTGGLIARALTEIGGSSQWFERGFVTYSNDAKREALGVHELSLSTQGAVSEAVAREMAQGALRNSRAQLALSVTGVAGPGGAMPGKPVGTVAFGWATAERVESEMRLFNGDRTQVRLQTALHALGLAFRFLPASKEPAQLA